MRIQVLIYKACLAILCGLMLSGCADYDAEFSPNIKVYGHAGSGLKPEQYNFPANSLKSIKKAIADGADGVEVDVQMSKDSVLYLFHDDRLQGNTNGEGKIADLFCFELDDLFYRKAYLGAEHEPLLRLSELVDWINKNQLNQGISLNIQHQEVADQPQFDLSLILKVLEQTQRINTQSPIFIESTNTDQLEELVSRRTNEKIMWDTDLSEVHILIAKSKSFDGIVSEYNKTTKELVKMARDAELLSVIFGLRIYPNIREAFALEPDFVQTDNVPMTLSLRDR